MKRLICESCGSINIIRTGEYFVCQNCGTKYISENKTSAVIDMSSLRDNALINARRARSNEDWEEAERYYNAVEISSPDNAEAVFYSAYAKTRRAIRSEDSIANVVDALRILAKDIIFIDENYTPTDIDAHMSLLEDMSRDIRILCINRQYYDAKIIETFKAIHSVFCLMLEHITDSRKYDLYIPYMIRLYDMQVKHLEALMKFDLTADERAEIYDKLVAVHNSWHRIDPMHSINGFDTYNAQSEPEMEGDPKNTGFAIFIICVMCVAVEICLMFELYLTPIIIITVLLYILITSELKS